MVPSDARASRHAPGGDVSTPSHARDGNRAAQLVREAVDAVAAPALRDRIIGNALIRARRNEVPEPLHRLRDFVQGQLREALTDALGVQPALQVVESLEPILDVLELDEEEISEIRPSAGVVPRAPATPKDEAPTRKHAVVDEHAPEPSVLDSGETLLDSGEIRLLGDGNEHPTDAPPEMQPVAVLTTLDPSVAGELRSGLGDVVEVRVVADPISFLDAIQSTPSLAVIVVDARTPSVQPITLAAMAPDLPAGVRVLMWGVTEVMEKEIHALGPDTLHWVGCAADTPAEEVAFLCITMLRDVG